MKRLIKKILILFKLKVTHEEKISLLIPIKMVRGETMKGPEWSGTYPSIIFVKKN